MKGASVWMPLYVRDYLTDTSHLTIDQDGAYLRLLMHSWVTGPLPNDDEKLARMCKVTVARWARSIKAEVMAFFELGDAGWTQKRLEKERRGARKNTEQKSAAANAKWRKHNESGDAAASVLHASRICPSPSPSEREEESKKEPPTPKAKPKVAQASLAMVLPEWIPREAWDGFVENRRAMKKPLSEYAAGLLVKKLNGYRQDGLDVEAALNAAVIGGWQGVPPPKPNGHVNGTHQPRRTAADEARLSHFRKPAPVDDLLTIDSTFFEDFPV